MAYGHIKSPCKDCTDRVIGCHATCEKYIEVIREHEERKQAIAKSKEQDEICSGFRRTQLDKAKRSGRGRR